MKVRISADGLGKLIDSWPSLLREEHLYAENLSVIYSYLLGSDDYSSSLTSLTNKLLNTTVDRARKTVRAYSDYREVRGIEDFKALPLVDRAMVEKDVASYVNEAQDFAFASFSSGTSRGLPLIIPRSRSEQNFNSTFFSGFIPKSKNKLRRLGLSISTLNHGSVINLPSDDYFFPVDLREKSGFARAAHLLMTPFNISGFEDRISSITSTFRKLFVLCCYMLEREIRPLPGQLKRISCYGNFIPARQKRIVEDFFGCSVDDAWSMTEIFGSAPYDKVTSSFHPRPFFFTECLDLTSGSQIENGLGELVVSSVYPFTQALTLLRYRTGDLVQAMGVRDNGMLRSFRYKGRLSQCHQIPEVRSPLSVTDILSIIDDIPDLSRDETLQFRDFADAKLGKPPAYEIVFPTPGHLVLKLFTSFDPFGYPERSKQIVKAVRGKMLRYLRQERQDILEAYSTIGVALTRHSFGSNVRDII